MPPLPELPDVDPGLPSKVLARGIRRFRNFFEEPFIQRRLLPAAIVVGIALALIFHALFSAPNDIHLPSIVKIKKGSNVTSIALQLEQQHIIKSSYFFSMLLRVLGGDKHLQAGSYYFGEPQNLFVVAHRFLVADFELKPVRVYVIENMSVRDIADLLDKELAPFDKEEFLALAQPQEGFLYPDTYFFYPGQDPEEIVQTMRDNFDRAIAPLGAQITVSGKPLKDILTMASILVGEARTEEDRKLVAGILWKRISLGMPLQVDAPFGYVLDKNLTQLTHSDLAVASPYNTYKNKGLPPTPIGNPSIDAITAAVEPTKSVFLYYLSDSKGVMHYSETYAQHQKLIAKYLR